MPTINPADTYPFLSYPIRTGTQGASPNSFGEQESKQAKDPFPNTGKKKFSNAHGYHDY